MRRICFAVCPQHRVSNPHPARGRWLSVHILKHFAFHNNETVTWLITTQGIRPPVCCGASLNEAFVVVVVVVFYYYCPLKTRHLPSKRLYKYFLPHNLPDVIKRNQRFECDIMQSAVTRGALLAVCAVGVQGGINSNLNQMPIRINCLKREIEREGWDGLWVNVCEC